VPFVVPRAFARGLPPTGRNTIAGVRLPIVAPRARRFQVALVPETLRKTSLGTAVEGTPVHLEADLIGKWIAQLVAPVVRTPRRARS
jgi:riboflavin synthase